MIFDALITAVLTPLSWLLGLFPGFAAPSTAAWDSAWGFFGGALKLLDGWVNMPLLVTALGVVLSARVGMFVVDGIVWLYDKIPAKAT